MEEREGGGGNGHARVEARRRREKRRVLSLELKNRQCRGKNRKTELEPGLEEGRKGQAMHVLRTYLSLRSPRGRDD